MDKSSVNIRSVLISNLRLLFEDETEFKKTYKTDISETSFDSANNKTALYVLHFLTYKVYRKLPKSTFMSCWPITDKTQEAEFKKIIVSLLEKACDEFPDFYFPRVNASTLVTTYGTRFCMFLIRLTNAILQKELHEMDDTICFGEIPSETDKPFLKLYKSISKDYVKSTTEKLKNELIYQEKLRQYWKETSKYFESIYLNYQDELKDIKAKQNQYRNDQFLSDEDLKTGYQKVEEFFRQVDLTSNNFSKENFVDLFPKPGSIRPEKTILKIEKPLELSEDDLEDIKEKYSNTILDDVWKSISLEIKARLSQIDFAQNNIGLLINKLKNEQIK